MLASHCLLPVPRRHPHEIGCALVWIMAMLILAGGPSEAAETGRDGLVLEYKFEADAKDSSGNARHGTTIGKPRFVAGKSGQCIELDGQQDYVDCGTTLADLGQTFTVECWVNPAARQNLHADVFGNHNHGGYGFVVEQDADNTNRFAAAYGAGVGAMGRHAPGRDRGRQVAAPGAGQDAGRATAVRQWYPRGGRQEQRADAPFAADAPCRGQHWGGSPLLSRPDRRVPRVAEGPDRVRPGPQSGGEAGGAGPGRPHPGSIGRPEPPCAGREDRLGLCAG